MSPNASVVATQKVTVTIKHSSLALLRPAADTNAQDAVRDLNPSAYAEYEQAA